MMTHEQVNELLPSFALDAVDYDEQDQIERHLTTCPRCRAELDAHREVAAALGNSVEPLPEGLWSSIADRLPERRDEEPPPMPRLVHGDPVEDVKARRHRRPVGATRTRLVTVGSIAVAAAAVAAVLGINLVRADNRVSSLQSAIGQAAPTAVVAALETPGHHLVDLDSAAHRQLAQFVLVPDGQGYLVSSRLSALSSKYTYQLWGVVGGQPISLGLLGQSPDHVTFTMAGSPTPTKLGITVEPMGGSVVPTGSMVASGLA